MRKAIAVVLALFLGAFGVAIGSHPAAASGNHTVAVPDASAEEGSAVEFTITPNPKPHDGETITVDYTTVDGTATVADNDYTATSGSVAIVDPAETATVSVPTIEDSSIEADETFTLRLTGATASDGTISTTFPVDGTGTITNDDLDVSVFSISDGVPFRSTPSKDCTFTITRTGGLGGEETVDFDTQSGTATEGTHFANASGTLTFAIDDTSETVVVDVLKRSRKTRNFTMELSNPSGGSSISDGSGLCKIKKRT